MPAKYQVEIGRVALINYGDDAGKLAAIVDVIDQNRALVDGTASGVRRQAIQFKRLRLTRFKVPIAHTTTSKTIQKLWAKEDIDNKFAETSVAKQLKQRAVKSNLNDFERFKLYKAKQQYNRIVKKKVALLSFKKKAANKAKNAAPKKKK